MDETVGLWRWDRLPAFFRSDQPQVTITQAPVVFLNRFLCIVVLSFSFRPVFFWSGRPGRLQALARPPLADPHDMIEVVRDAAHAKVPLKAELLYPTMAGRLNATAAFQAPAFLGRKV